MAWWEQTDGDMRTSIPGDCSRTAGCCADLDPNRKLELEILRCPLVAFGQRRKKGLLAASQLLPSALLLAHRRTAGRLQLLPPSRPAAFLDRGREIMEEREDWKHKMVNGREKR